MQEKDIEYVLAVVKHQSFSKAAEALYIAQPSLSRYIRSLEKRLQLDLFDRSTVPVRLTAAGERFVEYADKVQKLENELYLELKHLRKYHIGKLRLGAPHIIGDYILPRLLPQFSEKFPGIQIDVEMHNTNTLIDMLLSSRMDLVIISDGMERRGYVLESFAQDRILLIAKRDYPALKPYGSERLSLDENGENSVAMLKIDIRDLEEEQFIQCHPSMVLYKKAQKIFSEAGIAPKNIIHAPNLPIAHTYAKQGLGFAFILRSMLKYGTINPSLCSIEIPGAYMPIYLFYSTAALEANPLLPLLREHIHEEFQGGPL